MELLFKKNALTKSIGLIADFMVVLTSNKSLA
jgi:hypothetical protein